MSDFAARQALERMNFREVAVAAAYSMLASDLRQMAAADPQAQEQKFLLERREELCQAYGFSPSDQRKPFAFSNGIAIIPISGSLINRFGQSYGYVTGYNFIRRQLALAHADDDVKGIVFDVNSPGGEAAGCFELSDEIYKSRGKKPMIAVVDSNCYSAAYALASAADKLIVTPSGGAGSIGVVAMHVDMSKMLDEVGVKITFITFGAHKVDGNPYEALGDDAKAEIQASVNKSGDKFVSTVARNRKMDAAKVKATEARCYRAEEAKSLGLIDTVATPIEAMQVFFDELTGSVNQPGKEEAMSSAENQPATTNAATPTAATTAAPAAAAPANNDAAVAEARTAEKARIKSITGSEEAKGKSNLANHLAMDTSMSVEDAKKVLVAAAPEAAAAATSPNPFAAAMNSSEQPNVGAGQGGGTDATASKANEILASQASATGLKLVSSK